MNPSAFMGLSGQSRIGELAGGYPALVAQLRPLSAVKAAATFTGLLTKPELQANCLRLELLIHFCTLYCQGSQAPTVGFIRRAFDCLSEGYCGMQEDPSEDVFVGLVDTRRGNFRSFEGIREGNAFHLQRVLNVIESMPSGGAYDDLRISVESLLRISDAVAERAGVADNQLGQELPLESLPADLVVDLSLLSDIVTFKDSDLETLGVSLQSLNGFVFDLNRRSHLSAQSLGHTDLERCPLINVGKSIYVLLPTAIGSAITRCVVEFVISRRQERAFGKALAAEFSDLFRDTPLLGPGIAVRFQNIDGGMIGAALRQVDPGRFLHLVFFVDGLDGFSEGGVAGVNTAPESLASALMLHVQSATEDAKKVPEFLDGLTLLVGCGYGRELHFAGIESVLDAWRIEPIAANDLVTLGWLQEFDCLSLWRILDARTAIQKEGVELFNMNGLLNLVAWAFENGGHLVSHGQLPDDFVADGYQGLVQINQNSLRHLRHKVAMDWDPRRILDTDGRLIAVKKSERTSFAEDNAAPFYVSIEALQSRRLRAAYVAKNRPWWIEIQSPENSDSHYVYESWMMLCTWLRIAAPVLDLAYSTLPPGPVGINVRFAEVVGTTQGQPEPKEADDLRSLMQLKAVPGECEIDIEIGAGFDDGWVQPDNVAERVLLEFIVKGASVLAGEARDIAKSEELIVTICPNAQMRYMHRLPAQGFRDYLGSKLGRKPLLVDPFDHAASLIGLGWRDRKRELGPEVKGVAECTSYLNRVVESLMEEICEILRKLDRRSVLIALLLNHEAAARDRDVWRRTSQAALALHRDRQAALDVIVMHDGKLNVCFTLSRTLAEAALCECPLVGGRPPGHLDLTRLLSRAFLVFYFGGDSDAVHWGAMEPFIRVTPLGDIHMKRSFDKDVYQPFVVTGGTMQIEQAVKEYSQLYSPAPALETVVGIIDESFLHAWKAEFGISIDAMRTFIEQMERIGIERKEPIVSLRKSGVTALLAEAAGIVPEVAAQVLALFTLEPRPKWQVTPNGFHNRDWQPWRFRRCLSALRRPLFQIHDENDPEILIAPGLVREAFWATMRSFYDGDIHQAEIRSPSMESWIGHISDKNGTEFAQAVGNRLNELGWKTEVEIEMTNVLARRNDPRFGNLKRYGDVDVLAWRDGSPRVLAIECKDVHFRKTPGEVAEQLSDFRGELRPNKKPDLLKRHLDRLEVLTTNVLDVAKRLKLQVPIAVEGHLVFRNPVPMTFAWEQMKSRIRLSVFGDLDKL